MHVIIVRLRKALVAVMLPVTLGACSTTGMSRVAEPQARGAQVAGRCPQPRETERAPDTYYVRTNPLPGTVENLERGRLLYQRDARPAPCASCHGADGGGQGPAGRDLVPPPRNFTCADTMRRIPDGQLYWVIERGSGTFHLPARQAAQEIERPGRGTRFTAMRAYREDLSETDIWQIIMYIRTLARE